MLIETRDFDKLQKYLSDFRYSYVKHLSDQDILFNIVNDLKLFYLYNQPRT